MRRRLRRNRVVCVEVYQLDPSGSRLATRRKAAVDAILCPQYPWRPHARRYRLPRGYDLSVLHCASDVAVDIDRLVEAIDEAVRTLRASKQILEGASEALSMGATVESTMEATRAAETRAGANSVLDDLESARHQARVSMFAAALNEGMTIAELGRAWGISRQLSARYAKEASAIRVKHPFAS